MRHDDQDTIGLRLAHIRGRDSQRDFAEKLGIPIRTYQSYEQGREPDLRTLSGIFSAGWNLNWLLMGEGPERLEGLPGKGFAVSEQPPPPYVSHTDAAGAAGSQTLQLPDLKLAVQLAEEALDGRTLGPNDYAQLVTLIYDALVNGLPSAQVLAFARPAARGLSGDRGDGGSAMGGSGEGTTGKGGAAAR